MRSATTREIAPLGLDLRALSRELLDQARAEAHQILEDARVRSEGIHQEAQRRAEARRREILQRARREVEPIRSQAVASAQLEAQKLRLEAREQLLDRVFSTAQEQLGSAPQWPDYPEILGRLIREAAANLFANELILHADAQTQAFLTDAFLADLGQQLGVHLRRDGLLSDGVGIMAETPDGHRRYRNTLETRLERLQPTLRAPIYRLLRGGSP